VLLIHSASDTTPDSRETPSHARQAAYYISIALRGFSKTLPVGFEVAARRTTKALKQEGFGIMTEIDVKEAFQKKLGTEFRNYRILGACNPALVFCHKHLNPAASRRSSSARPLR
jgi:hypothetical protein